MKRFALGVTVTVIVALVGAAWAEENKDAPPLRLELDLVDGSHIIGTPGIETVPVETSYAKMTVPLRQIRTMTIGGDHETVTIDMQNGDKLKGVINLEPIRLETICGKISVGVAHVRQIVVVLEGAAQKGLVLWNRLGSESEVRNSRVGPGGEYKAGRFVEGRFGQGVELNMQQQMGVSFPAQSAPQVEGCIEFWAKLVNFPAGIPDGPNPALLKMGPGDRMTDWTFELALGPNDGNSNGGIIINSSLGWVGTGPFGGWTYARAMGAENASGWHHYALVWKGDGSIPGVTDTGRKIVVYVDGKLNTATGINNPNVKAFAAPAETDRLSLLGRATTSIPGASVIFDNLKIWNYAKTDFSDRERE
jgi:hypothetical protein